MVKPGIELRWGEGFESPQKRATIRSLLETSVELTRDGLTEFQIGLTDRKRVVIHNLNRPSCLAETPTPKTIHLYLRPYLMAETEINSFRISGILFHELVHSVRMETYQPNSSLEFAATEGLAYVADRKFSDSLYSMFDRPKYGIGLVGRVAMMPEIIRRQYRRDFIKAATPDEGTSNDVYKEWILDGIPKFPLGKGVVVGIDAVSKHIQAGREIADLIDLPTNEVLAVA